MAPRSTSSGSGERRSAQFVQHNLALLGFGSHECALVQTVKELFENALDATRLSTPNGQSKDAPPQVLRIHVRGNPATGVVDVVCADNGSGIQTHQLTQLCCGVFATTKSGRCAPARAPAMAGKYGVGLKAAMLYSQQHVAGASLKIVTAASSAQILYVQLRIDASSEEPAVVQQLAQFVLSDAHEQFSGTEMRLSLPCPRSEAALERAADTLATYFETARYTLPPFIGVAFCLDVGTVRARVECALGDDPIDRFTADLGASLDDIVYVERTDARCAVNCMAFMAPSHSRVDAGAIEICVLRFANHVPLVNADTVAQCGVVRGVAAKRAWKKLGLECRATGAHLVNQLVATPLRGPGARQRSSKSEDARAPRQLVLAIDVCARSDNSLTYGCLAKHTLAPCYSDAVRQCCESVLQQLVASGALRTPQQCRDDELVSTFAPLLARAVVGIAKRAVLPPLGQSSRQSVLQTHGCDRIDVDDVTARVRALVMADIGYQPSSASSRA